MVLSSRMIERANKPAPFFGYSFPPSRRRSEGAPRFYSLDFGGVCPAVNAGPDFTQDSRLSALRRCCNNAVFNASDSARLESAKIRGAGLHFISYRLALIVNAILPLAFIERVIMFYHRKGNHIISDNNKSGAGSYPAPLANCEVFSLYSPSAGMNLRLLRFLAYPCYGMVTVFFPSAYTIDYNDFIVSVK